MRPLLLMLLCLAAPSAAQTALRAAAPLDDRLGEVGEATGAGAELAFVRTIFDQIQHDSFALNREICGYIGYNRLGELVHTIHSVGEEAACELPPWPLKMVVIASYHTHSTYSLDFDSEVPSSTDMESDEASGIDGYVATPGGRLWFVDSDTMTVGQVCGIGCLPMDPHFVAARKGSVRVVYSYAEILKREAR